MNLLSFCVSIVSITGTIFSIFFASLTNKKNYLKEEKTNSKTKAEMAKDIAFIKECVDRVEKNLYTTDEKYQNMIERVVRLEEAIKVRKT